MADGARVRATPLRYAAFHGHARAVEELLAAGATPALRDPDRRQTALELALIGATAGGRMTVHGHGHAEVIRALETAAAAAAAAAPAAAPAPPALRRPHLRRRRRHRLRHGLRRAVEGRRPREQRGAQRVRGARALRRSERPRPAARRGDERLRRRRANSRQAGEARARTLIACVFMSVQAILYVFVRTTRSHTAQHTTTTRSSQRKKLLECDSEPALDPVDPHHRVVRKPRAGLLLLRRVARCAPRTASARRRRQEWLRRDLLLHHEASGSRGAVQGRRVACQEAGGEPGGLHCGEGAVKDGLMVAVWKL